MDLFDLCYLFGMCYLTRVALALTFVWKPFLGKLGYRMYKVSFNQEICYTNRKLVFIVGLLYLSCNGDALSPKVTWIKGIDSKS